MQVRRFIIGGAGLALLVSIACRGGSSCANTTTRDGSRTLPDAAPQLIAFEPDAAPEPGTPADSGADAGETDSDAADGSSDAVTEMRRCPKDMVSIQGRFCIDRYEDSLVDDKTGERLSPHYPPEPRIPMRIFAKWEAERMKVGPPWARSMPLPLVPEIEQEAEFLPRAVSMRGVYPQAYVSGRVAADACGQAKKRLCTHEEWMFACRGENQTKYPYGSDYEPGICNVFRMSHPAQLLHENASAGHSDPRLGLVKGSDGALLRTTGSTKTCMSRWGKDAIYDMVGNVDEWIDDPDGTFVGGFFSRSTKEGCDSIVTVHPLTHWDYSIGFRCCR